MMNNNVPVVEATSMLADRWSYSVSFTLHNIVHVMVTEHSRAIIDWMDLVLPISSVVGVGVFSTPGNPVAEVFALCCGRDCIAIRLRGNRLHFPEEFYSFLGSRNRTFVGLNFGPQESSSLVLANPRLVMVRIIDVRNVVFNGTGLSLPQLSTLALGMEPVIDPATVNNWSLDVYTDNQIHFISLVCYVNCYHAYTNRSDMERQAAWEIRASGAAGAIAEATRFATAAASLEEQATVNPGVNQNQ